MCGDILDNIFGIDRPDTSGVADVLKQQADAQDRALKLQKQATAQAKAAAIPPEDSEAARRAAEDRMRKLLDNAAGGKRTTGEPPVGYRMLTGA